jgi:uncharacterized protein
MRFLVLPGIGNSGPKHWQTLWEQSQEGFQRIQQRDWDHPVCSEWVAALEEAVESAGPETVLVAHSLACLLVAHWAVKTRLPIKAALLVAVPDPTGPNFPKDAIGFHPVPFKKFPFPSTVVFSSNDPYGPLEFAELCSRAWGSRVVKIGAAGHINGSSNLGQWPVGFSLLRSLAKDKISYR